MRRVSLLALVVLAACGDGRIGGRLAPLDQAEADAGAVMEPAPDAEPVTFPDAAPNAQPDAGPRPPRPDAAAPPDTGPADTGPDPDGWPAEWAAREDAMLVLVNAQRAMGATCGNRSYEATTPLRMNAQLRTAARLHSQDMADQNYFDHTGLDGSSPWDRIRRAAYAGAGIGENIAAGNVGAEATFQQWLTSPGHCSNMMNPDAREIGVGYGFNSGSRYRHYWTQTFGR